MTVRSSLLKSRQCGQCGHVYFLIQSGEAAEALRASIEGDLRDFDVIVLGGDSATCSNCGAVINLPAEELLDIDRSGFGRLLQSLAEEYDDDQKPAQGDHKAD